MSSSFDEAFRLHRQGRLREAQARYREVIAQDPSHFDAHHLLGVAYHQQGEHARAVEAIGRALALNPHHSLAHSNLGHALHRQGRLRKALASFDAALAETPDCRVALCGRGAVLLELGRGRKALACCEHALALDPLCAPAWHGLAQAEERLGQGRSAVTSYERALAIEPQNAQVWFDLGRLLSARGEHERAADAFVQVLACTRSHPPAQSHLLQSRAHCCDWSSRAVHAAAVLDAVRAGEAAVVPLAVMMLDATPEAQLQCARAYSRRWAKVAAAPRGRSGTRATAPRSATAQAADERIRIAYLCDAFGLHAAPRLLVGTLQAHDRTRFHVTGIAVQGGDADGDGATIRQRLRAACDDFIDARGLDDRAVARLMRARGIDIAVDLNGYHSPHGRHGILALRPAPVQVSYLGFAGTTGAPWMDYLLADACLVRPGEEPHFAEQVVRLPGSCLPAEHGPAFTDGHPAPCRADAGLPEDGVVFCSFSDSWRITPEVFAVWMRLLARVEGSVLWLLEDNATASRNLRLHAQQAGIGMHRLAFASRLELPAHRARMGLASICLDTAPHGAQATAGDALWAGVPLVTCAGATLASRLGASLLQACGLADLVASDLDGYEALAYALATQPALRQSLRQRVARARDEALLFDTRRASRHLETAYQRMWEHSRAGRPAQAFDVTEA
jgi:predicted O-linked N-acetylglucosamine transferase (SPINDLY family)